jgi:hypothetical protein
MKPTSIMLAALVAAFCTPAVAQQNYLNPTGGAARAPVCKTADLKACKDLCKDDYDDNVRLLCSKNEPGDADCKKQQSKLKSQCSDGCQKKWCG